MTFFNGSSALNLFSFPQKITLNFFFLFFSFLLLGSNASFSQNCINTPQGSVTSTPISGGCDLVVDLCILVDGSPRPKRIEYTINYDSNGNNIKDATQTFVFLPGGSGAPNGTHCLSTFAPSESFIVPGVACNTDFDATIAAYTSAGGGGGNLCHEFIGNLTEEGGFVENSLPVELANFDANIHEKSNQLKWETASEKNVHVFVIERMGKGESDFEELHRILAEGNSSTQQYYVWEDFNPLQLGYYRLRIIDFDGSFEYSPILAVERSIEGLAVKNIFPNPISNSLNVEFFSLESDVSINIIDIQGRVSVQKNYNIEKGFNQLELNLIDLSKGIYFLKINDGRREIQKRIIKR